MFLRHGVEIRQISANQLEKEKLPMEKLPKNPFLQGNWSQQVEQQCQNLHWKLKIATSAHVQ